MKVVPNAGSHGRRATKIFLWSSGVAASQSLLLFRPSMVLGCCLDSPACWSLFRRLRIAGDSF